MTNHEPGRELDRVIHENVMKQITYSDCDCWYGADDKPIPFYSTDISAAWLVVEKFKDWRIIKEPGKTVNVLFNYEYTARSESVPHAICLAALAAVNEV